MAHIKWGDYSMGKLIALMILLLALDAQAACGSGILAAACDGKSCITISEECEDPELMINVKENKRKSRYSFSRECTQSEDKMSFSCHTSGHTIFAGRTYKLEKRGKFKCALDNSWVQRYRFVCVKGCEGKSRFKYLDAANECI